MHAEVQPQPAHDVEGTHRFAWRAGLLATLLVALYGGFCDVGLTMLLARPIAFHELPTVLAALAASTATVCVLFVACWAGAHWRLRRSRRSHSARLAVLASICVCLPVPLVSVLSLGMDGSNTIDWIVLGCCGALLLFAPSVYRKFRPRVHDTRLRPAGATACVVGPCVMAMVCGLLWWQSYRATDALSASVLGPIGIGVFFGTGVTWALARRKLRLRVERFLVPFVAVVVLIPLAMIAVPSDVQAGSTDPASEDHAIRHVILLTVDTLRADMLSCYGSSAVQTPNIDRLARDGVLFERAVSAGPWTLPAVASMMTGVYPSVHGVRQKISDLVPMELETLAERMQAAGYRTTAIGDNPFLVAETRISQGFHEYRFFAGPVVRRGIGGRVLEMLLRDRFLTTATSDDLTRLACDWVIQSAGQESLLWLHYLDPHVPYAPPPEYLPDFDPPGGRGSYFCDMPGVRAGYVATSREERDWITRLYEGEVRYVDACVGRVLDALERLGIYEESLIVFLSDHGEELWDHDGFEHGHTLYDELIHVPMIVKVPGIAGGRRSEQLVSTAAVTPTICDLCGIEFDSQALSVGSFAATLRGEAHPVTADPVYSAGLLYCDDREAVVFDGLKYIRSTVTGREMLFDLTNDPAESTSLASLASDRMHTARAVMEQVHESAGRLREHYFGSVSAQGGQSPISQQRLEQLRSLGYAR